MSEKPTNALASMAAFEIFQVKAHRQRCHDKSRSGSHAEAKPSPGGHGDDVGPRGVVAEKRLELPLPAKSAT